MRSVKGITLHGSGKLEPANEKTAAHLEDSTTGYEYRPLSNASCMIRVLRILPQSDCGCPSLTLQVYPLAEMEGRFDAVSYTWGPKNGGEKVLVDGYPMYLRDNIWRFLRYQYTPGVAEQLHHNLWIDSICINQDDDEEKGQQVSQMGRIFSMARQVVIWLGSESEDPCLLRDYCIFTGRAGISSWDSWGNFCHASAVSEDALCTFGNLHCARSDLTRLLNNPYWMRAWIIQEISLAKSVSFLCGTALIPLSIIKKAMETAGNKLRADDTYRSRQHHMETVFSPRHGPESQQFSLCRLIYETRHTRCTVPHDRVYALLGLVQGIGKFPVDYNISMEQLFFRVLQSTIGPCTKDSKSQSTRAYIANMDDLARALDMHPEDVVKHPKLSMEVTSRQFEIALPLKGYWEPCWRNGSSPHFSGGAVSSTVCFVRRPFDRQRDKPGPDGASHQCDKRIQTNCLLNLGLHYSGYQFRDCPNRDASEGRRRYEITLLLTETATSLAVCCYPEGSTMPKTALLKVEKLPPQLAIELDADVIRRQIDLTKETSYFVRLPASFAALVELRRLSMDVYDLGPELTSEHVCKAGHVDDSPCETVKRLQADAAVLESARQKEIARKLAYERMNPLRKLAYRAAKKLHRD